MKICAIISLAVASTPTAGSANSRPPLAATTAPLPTLAIESALVLSVTDARAAADALVDKTEQLGGYFARRDDQSVELKVPTAALERLRAFGETLGTVLQRTHRAHDLRMQLAQQRTRQQSKRKMLDRYLDVLKRANARAIVAVERQVTALVAEIESLRGSIQVLEHRLQLAKLQVSFRLEKRATPVPDGVSPFPWLNTVDLVDLYRDFTDVR